MGGERGRLISREERHQAIELINEAHEKGARKFKACEILGISLRTLERWEKPGGTEDKRPTSKRPPQSKQLTEEEKQQILSVATGEEYCHLPPCKIVPLLADKGEYLASTSSFYRVLRKAKLINRRTRKSVKPKKPQALAATSPRQVWCWDISYLPTHIKGEFYYLYLVMDVYSRKIVGWNIHENERATHGASLIKQACIDECISENQLALHSDNGAPMRSIHMFQMLRELGVMSSFSRPSVSNDNPYSESLFRTIKHHEKFPIKSKFGSIREARLWMESFSVWYNNKHLHSGLNFITPMQRHTGKDEEIFQYREEVFKRARARNPLRWSGKVRNWYLPDIVTLNPEKEEGSPLT